MYSISCHSFYTFCQNEHRCANIAGRTAAKLILVWDTVSYSHLKVYYYTIYHCGLYVCFIQPTSVLFLF